MDINTTMTMLLMLQNRGFVMKDKEYLYVCERCLMAIESREGNLARKIYRTDEEDELDCTCDWCEESGFSELYQLIKG